MRRLVLFPIFLFRLIISPWHLRKIQPVLSYTKQQAVTGHWLCHICLYPTSIWRCKFTVSVIVFESVTEFIYRVNKRLPAVHGSINNYHFDKLGDAKTYVSGLSHHWFRQWLVTCSTPRHYLKQLWLPVNWTLGNKSQYHCNVNSSIFCKEMHLKISSASWFNPQCV